MSSSHASGAGGPTTAAFEDHDARHVSGGADAIKLDDLAAPDDNTDLNVSTTAHGLTPKLDNVATNFLNGQGAFAAPAGGAPTAAEYVTAALHASLSAEVVIPGLAGSPDRAGQGGGSITQEFDSGASPLTWGSALDVETVDSTIPSHLYIEDNANAENIGSMAWAPGAGAIDARAKVAFGGNLSGAASGLGLHIGSAVNADRLLLQIIRVSAGIIRLRAFTFAAAAYTQRGINTDYYGTEVYLRISRDGANSCSFWYSSDGKVWTLIATQALTLTIANIGFRMHTDAAETVYAAIDWLRAAVS